MKRNFKQGETSLKGKQEGETWTRQLDMTGTPAAE